MHHCSPVVKRCTLLLAHAIRETTLSFVEKFETLHSKRDLALRCTQSKSRAEARPEPGCSRLRTQRRYSVLQFTEHTRFVRPTRDASEPTTSAFALTRETLPAPECPFE